MTTAWAATLCFCAAALPSGAQVISAASSGRVAGVTQSTRSAVIARSPGGERVGLAPLGVSEPGAQVVKGRVAGYGARLPASQGESVYGGVSNPMGNMSRDFPTVDFVATMPGLSITAAPLLPSPLAASPGLNFATAGRHGGAAAPHHAVSSHSPRTGNSILNPFTHTLGNGIGSKPGALTTLPGSGH